MPKLTGSNLPRYRKHVASGQAVVTLCGKDFYLGRFDTKSSRAEYDRLIGEWLASGRRAPSTKSNASGETTIVEMLASYVKHARQYYRKNGQPTTEYDCILEDIKDLKTRYGRMPVADFSPLKLKALRQSWIDLRDENGRLRLCRGTINARMRRITRVFRWAASEELCPASVPQSLAMLPGLRKGRTAARETKPVLPVSDDVVEKTLAQLGGVVADMVRLQRATGMRPSEVCSLRPMDVNRSDDVWLYVPADHKTQHHGRSRTVAIGPNGQAVLSKYLLREASAFCFDPREADEQHRRRRRLRRRTPLYAGSGAGGNRKRSPKRRPTERYDVDAYRRAIHRGCDRAKIERWSPNRLRHSTATQIRREFGLEAAQVVLGHAALGVTQVYAERDFELAKRVASMIG